MNKIVLSLLSFLAGMSIGFVIAYLDSVKKLRQLMEESDKYAEMYMNELKKIYTHKQKSSNNE